MMTVMGFWKEVLAKWRHEKTVANWSVLAEWDDHELVNPALHTMKIATV